MNSPLRIIALFTFFISTYVHADIAVLVHGYHSNGSSSWRVNGIVQHLNRYGWQDAGIYTPEGNHALFGISLANSGLFVVTAELPSESPIEIQASLLSRYLNDISEHFTEQKIHIIAHSAGGIVARLALVNIYQQGKQANISQLITIATPHLGSVIAEVAKRTSNSPLSIIAPVLGASEINRAKILYQQLGREEKNSFLFWLNRQPHPPMKYTSIIRKNGSFIKGDWLVPAQSQNMALVPAIGKNAQVILTKGDHYLDYRDVFLFLPLLSH